MNITDILSPDCTRCAVQGTSKKRILEIISEIAASHISQSDQATILASLLNRERMGSTGIGNGIALPHGRLAGLDKVTAILVTTESSIDFDAIDNQPVDVFFAILVPEDQAQGHLQTLATVAGCLNDKQRVKEMRSATQNQELFEAIA
ncbi:PTS IIA-like nitrogen regulatory protein PtsN [Aestuariibacter halophilus]|uniref:PTS IIA-like nitrogen regulatory protein PtsN n=1 Tax=Fluctibacter halophilus TaxID=226011 RepID=A0ABS8GBT3_9ALTE|nr:PTS IIA-like nitrogen regulatory protein PtsN [Aestuariibacter halophilus]MCC2617853.1 PTS IIA-like nitrogen regulatory protein PtsN [Aestuariibacter halophilus]